MVKLLKLLTGAVVVIASLYFYAWWFSWAAEEFCPVELQLFQCPGGLQPVRPIWSFLAHASFWAAIIVGLIVWLARRRKILVDWRGLWVTIMKLTNRRRRFRSKKGKIDLRDFRDRH